jgi:hypothetical protein
MVAVFVLFNIVRVLFYLLPLFKCEVCSTEHTRTRPLSFAPSSSSFLLSILPSFPSSPSPPFTLSLFPTPHTHTHTHHPIQECDRVVTPEVLMSDETWKISFGKFLEIGFYNRTARGRTNGCTHCIRYKQIIVTFPLFIFVLCLMSLFTRIYEDYCHSPYLFSVRKYTISASDI